MGELRFRPYRPGDEVAINDTFNAVFGTDRSLEEWRWKFQRGPVESPIMLATENDDLLAHYAGVPVRLRIEGRTVLAAQIVDVFSTKRARRRMARRGVWVQTVESFFSAFGEHGELQLLFGFPGRRALRLGILQLGYDAMDPQPVIRWERAAGTAPWDLRRLPYRAEEIRGPDERLDALWAAVADRYAVAAVRDADRVRQRLIEHPRFEYRLFLILPRFGRRPVAFAAFRTDDGVVRWIDLVWDDGHPGALHLVAHLGATLVRQHDLEREILWLTGDGAAADILRRLGFSSSPQPDGLVVVARSFDPEIDVRRLEGRVYITMADADLG